MSAPRIVCAGLFHETNTFVEGATRLVDFQLRRGEEMLAARGDSSPWGGALETAAALGWKVEPLLDARAVPSGIVDDEVLEEFWQEFTSRVGWSEDEIDGVFLVLHGAMVTSAFRDVEGELLRRIREVLGWRRVPLVAVLDLHANVSPLMARHAHGLIGYRENPHWDARETAQRAVHLLHRQLTAKQPFQVTWRATDLLWPPGGTGSAQDPMRALEALARQLEREVPGVIEASIFAGFSFADVDEAGVSFALTHTPECADPEAVLDRLNLLAWEKRAEGNVCGTPAEAILASLRTQSGGPFVLAEESDNIGGGAPGDGTGLLRALLAENAQDAAVCLADPAAVEHLWPLAPGSRTTLPLGGRGSRYDAGPVTLEVEVVRRSEGRFELEDKQSHMASLSGDFFDMGLSVLVRHGTLFILLTTHRTPPMDLGQWRSVGVDPARLRFIGVKGAIAHRRAYDPIAQGNFLVDTPGPCRGDLRHLPYRFLRRPIYPLDSARP